MTHSLIGKTIGKYQIVENLGRGGMAEVYKAYQPALDRHVAIKIMHSFLAEEKNFLSRFQSEAKAVAQLRHPNIVQLYDFDVADGIYYYMVMEFIDGYTLRAKLEDVIDRNELLPPEEAIGIVRDVASALSYAHGHDMIHRDIKPSNVMIDREKRVVLTDFGIAKILSNPQYTISGGLTGTPSYISPEQGLGMPGDARSDIYSLGTMFFQIVTGRLPYEADTAVAVVLKHINDPLPPPSLFNPGLPPDIERIIFKAMAKNPDGRYQTANELIEHLDHLQAGRSILDTDPSVFSMPITTDPAAHTPAVFSAAPPSPSSTTFPFSTGTVRLPPYALSATQLAASPVELIATCDADWKRAVDQFVRGYITQWLRECISHLRAAHQHGLADDLELIVARGEAIIQRLDSHDGLARSAGLEEFLELLGATPPVMDITPTQLDLPAVGVGQAGQPVTLTIRNRERGYLFGTTVCRVPWLKATPTWFGCAAEESCAITVTPDLSGLPAGHIRSKDGLQIRSIGGDYHLPVRANILASALQVQDSTLYFGTVGQGEAAETSLTLRNSGQGYLIGRVLCRVPWLTASPEQFKVPAESSTHITVKANSEMLPSGDATHAWALILESNGGHAVLGVQMQVTSPHLTVQPTHIDLGTIDLAQPGAKSSAELTVCNTGPGVLTGAVTTEADCVIIEPTAFRCRAGEAQQVHLSTAELKTGSHRYSLRVLSNVGEAAVPVLLRVSFSLEPEMVHIPAGAFLRGSKERDRTALPSEKPQGEIYLEEYWIGKYPVTNALYAVFAEATGRRPPEHWGGGRPPEGKENHPVVNVSWWDATACCRWLAQVTGKPYRLPTEAQWEKAARGSDGRVYPWGTRWNSQKCNSKEGGKGDTTPVGAYSPDGDSPYGCADMAGNVLEWVADWYDAEYYARSTVSHNPFGPASGVVKALRGSSWYVTAKKARCASRYNGNPTLSSPEAGFRCALG